MIEHVFRSREFRGASNIINKYHLLLHEPNTIILFSRAQYTLKCKSYYSNCGIKPTLHFFRSWSSTKKSATPVLNVQPHSNTSYKHQKSVLSVAKYL
jgi:hypothetical protein